MPPYQRSKFKIDPQNGGTYTFADLSEYYAYWHSWKKIQDYWDYECIPVFPNRGKGKGKSKDQGKGKSKDVGKDKGQAKAKTKAKSKAKEERGQKVKETTPVEDDEVVCVSFVGLQGASIASWTGSPAKTIAEVKKDVAEQVDKHATRISLVLEDRKLLDDETLAQNNLRDEAALQLLFDDSMAEQKWSQLKDKLSELDYGSSTSEVYLLAVECLEIGLHSVDEVSKEVRDKCERAGSDTDMPDDWFEKLAEHPDSKCDTPAQWMTCDLVHTAIFQGISLADKPFFQNGPWTDKVDYPEWGWQARIGGTPLDIAARKLETSLENPPHWPSQLGRNLPKEDDELDRLRENFMVLLNKGFKMSRVENNERKLTREAGMYDSETSWKPALIERKEPPYHRYGAIYQAWCDAGKPLVTIPPRKEESDSD